MALEADNCIRNGDKVILRKEKNMQIATVQTNKKYNIEKMWFELSGSVGMPYGTVFEVKNKKVEPAQDDIGDLKNFPDQIEQGKDNRNIIDDCGSQKLSRDQIVEMRKQGEKGQDVVRQLVQNSSSFKEKTEFSQEKYIKKKNKKHLNRFIILRPSIRLLAEMYFNKGPAKINFLRIDALAQILTYGNVRAGTRQLVVESCNGLLAAATLERMADTHATSGSLILQLHHEQDPPRQALEGYPFTEDQLKIMNHLPLKFLAKVKDDKIDLTEEGTDNEPLEDAEVEAGPSKKLRLDNEEDGLEDINKTGNVCAKAVEDRNKDTKSPSSMKQESESMDTEDTEGKKNGDSKYNKKTGKVVIDQETIELKRAARRKQIDDSIQILRDGQFDSMLIAARVHPTPIAVRLLEYLKGSSPVCIFSPYKEPLIDCYQRLRDSGLVVHLRLSETWLRNYQVLPNRTHPEINMSTNGGYLLTFIKVSDKPVQIS